MGHDGMQLVRDVRKIYAFYNIKTVVISASIKSCYDAIQSIIAGADSIALTYPIFCQLLDHPVTREGIERFTDDYNSVYDK